MSRSVRASWDAATVVAITVASPQQLAVDAVLTSR